jgi:hypothetical protein
MHYILQKTGDARVHCAVLKKRTETSTRKRIRVTGKPALTEAPGTRRCLFPQDPTACPPSPRKPRDPVPRTPAGKRVLTRPGKPRDQVNNQCPTMSNGHPATHPVTTGARCSLERR